jgi:hypothetical protein
MTLCNSTLTTFFAQPENGVITMEAPIQGTSHSQLGNITLTFKTKDDTVCAKIHEEWVKILDVQTTIMQGMYAVIVHNAPASFTKKMVQCRTPSPPLKTRTWK